MTRRPRAWTRTALVLALVSWLATGTAQEAEDGAPAADASGEPTIVRVAVDPAGGPPDLREELEGAARAWREAGIDTLDLRVEENAPHLVRYGAPERLGPDVVTLTLRRSDAEGLEVLVHPQRAGAHPAALLRVVAQLAGVEAEPEGVFDPALREGAPEAPTEDDVRRWREARSFAPEDVNRDGLVDFLDLLEVAERYGERGVDLRADVDGSGVVDDADLRRLREAYVFTPPAEAPSDEPASSDTDGR